MKNTLIPSLTIAVLVLAGCSSTETEASSAAPDAATPAPTVSVAPASPSAEPKAEDSASGSTDTAPTPNRNDRGEIIKAIGENGGWKAVDADADDPNVINFKVTSITPAVCDSPYPGEANGIPMAVTLEIETTPDFEGPLSVNGGPGQVSFSPYYWKGYADNGTRMNTVESPINRTCLANQALLLPDYIGKAEKVQGQVILDVTTPTGTLSFSPDGTPGWEWEYPSNN